MSFQCELPKIGSPGPPKRSNLEMMTAAAAPLALSIEAIEHRIAPLRERLASHPLYPSIRTPAHLRLFMESHVYAVWDFMSLLKSLQRGLTCVDVPWVPTRFPASRRFINEIVLGEESDEYEGRPASHFELYLEAMEKAGASTAAIRGLIHATSSVRDEELPTGGAGKSVQWESWMVVRGVPRPAKRFMETTFRVIREGSLPAQAASFTFGREDAIPSMFRSLVRDLNHQMDGDLGQFVWYLERHIEVDGDEHGPLSLRMVADLCGDDPAAWSKAGDAAEAAIKARLALWDGILEQIRGA